MSNIRGPHKSEDHLKMTIDLTDLPLATIQGLKEFFVRRHRFEEAVRCREVEKIILKTEERLKQDEQKR